MLVGLALVCLLSPVSTLVRALAPIAITPLPTLTPRPIFASLTPSPTLQASATAVPRLESAQSTPIPALDTLQAASHLVLARPIQGDGNGTVYRVYPYGGTDNGRLQVHHGVDLVNTLGTPIHATADGTVVYAGGDLVMRFAPTNDYYGNLVVIQHNFLTREGKPVFTLYGHMQTITVHGGQLVREGDVIGTVGETGIALGPHLHLEVRVGSPFDFGATRNPELWLRPYPNFGTLVGRVTDADGDLDYGVTLTASSSEIARQTESYGDDSVNSDDELGENFTLGDIPADSYLVTVIQNGRVRFAQQVYVAPNQLTWLDVTLSP